LVYFEAASASRSSSRKPSISSSVASSATLLASAASDCAFAKADSYWFSADFAKVTGLLIFV
jgi:hypothetical protein